MNKVLSALLVGSVGTLVFASSVLPIYAYYGGWDGGWGGWHYRPKFHHRSYWPHHYWKHPGWGWDRPGWGWDNDWRW